VTTPSAPAPPVSTNNNNSSNSVPPQRLRTARVTKVEAPASLRPDPNGDALVRLMQAQRVVSSVQGKLDRMASIEDWEMEQKLTLCVGSIF
jgi:hypothetical protein